MTLITEQLSDENFPQVATFVCNEEVVTEYLTDSESALNHQKHNSVVTQLYCDERGALVGFSSLQVSSMRVDKSMIHHLRWNESLPKLKTHFPVLHLLFLGVDKKYENQGYGTTIMLEIIALAYKLVEEIGCNFIFVEAIKSPKTLAFYKKFGFFAIDDEDDDLTTLRMAFKIERLPIRQSSSI
ncbi:GNAT family N-acetyltransferase [Saccharibacillus brassicae]|uniref:GNAT family N-acetyltransferase n=1 Tax=Saccharibacillus brassicae TaxID=2583377 RepID=A0A4Y6UT90_SACBS|nr:GNAT family N-acetyltransferase [Saccharibacillus brassicae]QDH19547.1 GNAT family N-acetyltransferase [Saccharibacillus brassicae]